MLNLYVNQNYSDIMNSMADMRIKSFIYNYNTRRTKHQTCLNKEKPLDTKSFETRIENELRKKFKNLNLLNQSNIAYVNGIEYHTVTYDSSGTSNNYSIQFVESNQKNILYGEILLFVQESKNSYCLIKTHKKHDFKFVTRKKSIKKAFDKINSFFIKCSMPDDSEIVLICFDQIVTKAIKLEFENDLLISPCCLLQEHD